MRRNNRFITREARMILIMGSGDYFKCGSCGYTVRYKVLGNTARCSQCGGTMYRV